MERKKINYGLIIFILVLVLLFIPIILDYVKSQKIEVITSSELSEKIASGESFVLYVGDYNKNIKKELLKMRDYTRSDYGYEYSIYNINSYSGDKKAKVIFYIEGDVQSILNKYSYKKVNANIKKYYLNVITNDNKSYKVVENFSSFKKLVKSNDVNMFVFGRASCSYCNKFQPVYNALAEKYDVNIYYFDSDNYDEAQYKKIINIDLDIPSKCNSSDVSKTFKLSDGFGTPLSIFTKNGKVIDCISGYVNRSSLYDKLIDNDMISE